MLAARLSLDTRDFLALERLDFSDSISAHFPLTDAAAAVESLEKKIGDPVRLVLVP